MTNLNIGLLQRFHRDATLFWPFHFLEPNWFGSMFHSINKDQTLDIIQKLEKSLSIETQTISCQFRIFRKIFIKK